MNKLNICIACSHSFENYVILSNIVNEIVSGLDKFALTFISGNARGADSLGERYAKEHGFDLEIYPANWKKYGKEAGFIRNNKMASISDVLIAFWDGKSHGTNDMIKKMSDMNKCAYVFDYDGYKFDCSNNNDTEVYNSKDEYGDSLLHNAVKNDDFLKVRYLISKIFIDSANDVGNTPLFYTKSFEMADFLLSHGASVEIMNNEHLMPFHRTDNREIAKFLEEKYVELLSDRDEYFYLTKLTPKETRLPICIWIEDVPFYEIDSLHLPLKIRVGEKAADFFISISDRPSIICGLQTVTDDELKILFNFVKIMKNDLLFHAKSKIDTPKFIERLKFYKSKGIW